MEPETDIIDGLETQNLPKNLTDMNHLNGSNSEISSSGSIHQLNKSSQELGKSLQRRKSFHTIQTKLTESNPEYLKIDQNIPNYIKFWKNYFPAVINAHFAMNAMHTMGIGTNESPLQVSSKLSQVKLNFKLISTTINSLYEITQKRTYDDVFLQVYTHSVVVLSPIDQQFSVIIDPNGKLRYKKPIRKSNIPVNPTLKPGSWGNTFQTLHKDLLFMENNQKECVFVKSNDSSALSQKLKKLKQKYASYFSLSEFQEIIEIMSEVNKKSPRFKETKKKNDLPLIINFSPGIAIFNPRFVKKKKEWKLYLAARESENENL